MPGASGTAHATRLLHGGPTELVGTGGKPAHKHKQCASGLGLSFLRGMRRFDAKLCGRSVCEVFVFPRGIERAGRGHVRMRCSVCFPAFLQRSGALGRQLSAPTTG